MKNEYIENQEAAIKRIAGALGYIELAKASLKGDGYFTEVKAQSKLDEIAKLLRSGVSQHEANISGQIEKKRIYDEAYEDYMAQQDVEYEDPPKSPQQIRDEIVAKAKADVVELANGGRWVRINRGTVCNVDFIVNNEKRAVVVLFKGHRTGDVYAKGIAKADPSDCFNVHLGRAIALRRALGLEVPAEYYNAPAPTEVRVGDVVERSGISRTVVSDKQRMVVGKTCQMSSVRAKYGRIIDDSRE